MRSCDLLSILDRTIFDNNSLLRKASAFAVVICFQFLIGRSLTTTLLFSTFLQLQLWFAFNSWSDDLWQQQHKRMLLSFFSCDLLSILDRTIFDNNNSIMFGTALDVVICFQFLIGRSLTTTDSAWITPTKWLWFAFNSWSDDLWQQHVDADTLSVTSCDLLSILDRTIFDNNTAFPKDGKVYVVICFQFLIGRSLTTTLWQEGIDCR